MLRALKYEADTEVTDVDDSLSIPDDADTQPISMPRVSTDELAMHVIVQGLRHRRHPKLSTTSCGMEIHSGFATPMREEIVHPLSRDCGCFTTFEIAEADDRERQKYEAEP